MLPSQQPGSPEMDRIRQEAVQDEQTVLLESMVQTLQARAQALNVEVRLRDQRILELERELAEARTDAGPAHEPGEGPASA